MCSSNDPFREKFIKLMEERKKVLTDDEVDCIIPLIETTEHN